MAARVDPLAALGPPPFRSPQEGIVELPAPPEALLALLLATWAGAAGRRGLLHVARSETRAERLARAARSFAPELEVLLLPPWDCAPYDRASPSRTIMGRRVAALERLREPACPEGRLVVATVESLLQRLPPRSAWEGARLQLGPDRTLHDLLVWLISAGYVLDERVDEPGEAAVRGEVVDVFPGDADEPVRIEVADGRIGRIRRYNPVDQRTTADVESLVLRPASEVLLAQDVVWRFLDGAQQERASDVLIGTPERPRRAGALEQRLPLFYEQLETLFDYLPEATVSFDPEVEERKDAWLAQVADGYESRIALRRNGGAGDNAPAPLEPRHLYLDQGEWHERLAQRPVIAIRATNGDDVAGALPRFVDATDPARALARYVETRAKAGDRIVLGAPDRASRARLARMVARRTGIGTGELARWAAVSGLSAGTVVAAGLDIPNANTMLVWRADRFGLAQLHQLRGRVGRGARQAAIYLLSDPDTSLPAATEQRLRTLEAMEGLGAGYAIGAKDLDLRGAGDLLGQEQAGYVRLIGTELFQRLLRRALRRARGEVDAADCRLELQLGIAVFIPAHYVPEPEIRIALYRRLLELSEPAGLGELAEELVDRFGALPAEVEALLALAEIRLRCCALGIVRLEAGPKALALKFENDPLLRRAATSLVGNGAEIRIRERRLIVARNYDGPTLDLSTMIRLLEGVAAAQTPRPPQGAP